MKQSLSTERRKVIYFKIYSVIQKLTHLDYASFQTLNIQSDKLFNKPLYV